MFNFKYTIMKNKAGLCLILGFFILFVSCDNDSFHEEESEFVICSALKFVFVDANGSDMIDIDNVATYPFAFEKQPVMHDEEIKSYENSYFYNGNFNTLGFDSTIERYCWTTCLYGFDNVKSYNTYVHINSSDIDTISTKYSFSRDCEGRPLYAEIEEMYYNNTLVYSNGKRSKKLEPQILYIKKENGETHVVIE